MAQGPATARTLAPPPAIGFGCGDIYGGANEARSRRLIEAALEAGIAYFDVARLYGDGSAEGVVGKVLAPMRDKVTIVSKAGIIPWSSRLGTRAAGKAARLLRKAGPLARALVPEPPPGAPRFGAFALAELRRSIERSLKALRTDYLDILLLHECSPAEVRRPEMLPFLEGLRDKGKILSFGIATHFPDTLQILAETPQAARVVQFASDAVNRNVERLAFPPGLPGPERVVTHTPLKNALPALAARLAADPAAAAHLRDLTGIDPDDSPALAALLLGEAAAQNAGGTVLFSTSRPERIAEAVRAVAAPPSIEVRAWLRQALQ